MAPRNTTKLNRLALLEKLCNAVAVSGDEGEVRAIVIEQVRPYVDVLKVDALGNVLASTRGTGKNCLKVMLAAHMDEVGFMLVADDGEGLFRFETVGSIDARQIPGKAVLVGKEHVPGVIGAPPVHLTNEDDQTKVFPIESMRIDLGPEGSHKVSTGDRATFATRFQRCGPAVIAKALDDRFGVATLIELLKTPAPNIDLCVAFTTQEEINTRGAKVAAYAFDPDLAIVVDCTPARDLPTREGEENITYNTKLGLGPAIYIADKSTLYDPRLISHFTKIAQSKGIPYQMRQPGGGGTDAGAIHKQHYGIPSISVSVPGRYAHSPAGLGLIEDWENTINLLHSVLITITSDILM